MMELEEFQMIIWCKSLIPMKYRKCVAITFLGMVLASACKIVL